MPIPDLEIDLLRAFLAVAESRSFTAAADVIGRSQSAVSQKLLRLEEIVGEKVFHRSGRTLGLTPSGERLLLTARRIIALNDDVLSQFKDPPHEGVLRLGISEDFIPSELPKLLASFKRLFPQVRLELMTALSCDLMTAYDAKLLDAVIAKRDSYADRGRVIWSEPLVWMASSTYEPDFTQPERLVLLRPPCTYREVMISSLNAHRREWVAACTASNLMGVQAAVAAGLGVTVLGKSFLRPGFKTLTSPEHWPALPSTEIVVVGEESGAKNMLKALIEFLTHSFVNGDSASRAA
jgi:DNA-binding transcriptional LysR family regulator